MAISYSVSIPQLPALQEAFKRAPEITATAVVGAVNRSLVGYQATAKQLAPVSSGRLRSSILIRPATRTGSRIEGSVGTNVRYATWQEAGTGIYGPRRAPIRPRSAKMLRFGSGNRTVFARQVRGSRPRWYFRGSVERNQRATEGYFEEALQDVTRHLAGGTR